LKTLFSTRDDIISSGAAQKKAWQIAAAGQSVFSQRGLLKEENQNIMSSSCKNKIFI
jgi:hypothetical protein